MLAYTHLIQSRASTILKGVYALRIGTSSAQDVERLASVLGDQVSSKRCVDDRCYFEFYVDNEWLHKAHLEPLAVFQARVTVQRGLIDMIRVSLMRDTRVYPTHPSAGKVSEYRASAERGRWWRTPYEFSQPVGKPYIDVMLSEKATSEQRRRAYAFSLTCLTKIGNGCDLPCDYLPLAWQDWVPQWESDPLYRKYYPTRARCQ